MLEKVEDYKTDPGIGGWDSGFVTGAKEAYDECQNSLIHVIEEIKKL